MVAAVRDTCAMLSEGHPALLTGPVLQREHLALTAVLMIGRTDLEVITVPTAEGEGWAVAEPAPCAGGQTRMYSRTAV
ncbi:hypothetical protein IPZ70_19090 [Streptomyces polychromogenes]|nr:hypothetical protein [Streptomyces polychromogenes]